MMNNYVSYVNFYQKKFNCMWKYSWFAFNWEYGVEIMAARFTLFQTCWTHGLCHRLSQSGKLKINSIFN